MLALVVLFPQRREDEGKEALLWGEKKRFTALQSWC